MLGDQRVLLRHLLGAEDFGALEVDGDFVQLRTGLGVLGLKLLRGRGD
jgi:hypothetical protein